MIDGPGLFQGSITGIVREFLDDEIRNPTDRSQHWFNLECGFLGEDQIDAIKK